MEDADKISALEDLLAKIKRNGARPQRGPDDAQRPVAASSGSPGPSGLPPLSSRKSLPGEAEAPSLPPARSKPLGRPTAPPMPTPSSSQSLLDLDDDISLPLVMPEGKKLPTEARPAISSRAPGVMRPSAPVIRPMGSPAAPARSPAPARSITARNEDSSISVDIEERLTGTSSSPSPSLPGAAPAVSPTTAAPAVSPTAAAPAASLTAAAPLVARPLSQDSGVSIEISVEEMSDDDIEREWAEQAKQSEAKKKAEDKAEAERAAREKAEAERKAKEKAEAERKAKEKAEAERAAREKAEAERKAKEEAERIEREKAEAERKAKEKAEAERIEREKAEAERKAKEEAERIEREKAEAERVAKEKAEAARLAREEAARRAREEEEQMARELEEMEQLAREEEARAEADRKAKEEAERLAKEEAERVAKEEAERVANEEAERVAKEEAERLAKEEAERVAKAEAERVAKAEAERLANEEAERVAKEEAERLANEEAERVARRAEAERIANEEAGRLDRESAVQLVTQPPPPTQPRPISLDGDHLLDELSGIVFDEPALPSARERPVTPPPTSQVEPVAQAQRSDGVPTARPGTALPEIITAHPTPPVSGGPGPAVVSVPPAKHPPEDLINLVDLSRDRQEARVADDDVPASTPRPRPIEQPSGAGFGDLAGLEDDMAPPISGAIESQRLHKRAQSVSMGPQAAPNPGAQRAQSVSMGPQAAPNPGAQRAPSSREPAADSRVASERVPETVPRPRDIAEAMPIEAELAVDVIRRHPVSGPVARFVAAHAAFAPTTFGELLDASLELGAPAAPAPEKP